MDDESSLARILVASTEPAHNAVAGMHWFATSIAGVLCNVIVFVIIGIQQTAIDITSPDGLIVVLIGIVVLGMYAFLFVVTLTLMAFNLAKAFQTCFSRHVSARACAGIFGGVTGLLSAIPIWFASEGYVSMYVKIGFTILAIITCYFAGAISRQMRGRDGLMSQNVFPESWKFKLTELFVMTIWCAIPLVVMRFFPGSEISYFTVWGVFILTQLTCMLLDQWILSAKNPKTERA